MASPLLLLPQELLRIILVHLGPKHLLQLACTCHAGRVAADTDAVWRELLKAVWLDEMPMLLATEARAFFRQMRQPLAIMTAAPSACPSPMLLSHLVHEPLTWQEGSGSFLGEYRLLIEVMHEKHETPVLTAVVQPSDGMFGAGRNIAAGGRTAAFSTAAPPALMESWSSKAEWLRDAFGCYRTWDHWEGRTPVRRLSARLCVQWRDKVVCLGVVPGMHYEYTYGGERTDGADEPSAVNDAEPARDRCTLIFQWHMPALAVPDAIAEQVDVMDWRLRCISPCLYVHVEPCSAARDEWRPCSFRLEAEPQLVLPPADDEPGEDEEEFHYTGFEEDCETDMMALCFLHEAVAMSHRSPASYMYNM